MLEDIADTVVAVAAVTQAGAALATWKANHHLAKTMGATLQ